MNTKQVLIATLLAAVTGASFATEPAKEQTMLNEQFAQLSTRAEPDANRAMPRAMPRVSSAMDRNDTAPIPAPNKAESRPRADVRAETAKYMSSAEAREARQMYLGGQQ